MLLLPTLSGTSAPATSTPTDAAPAAGWSATVIHVQALDNGQGSVLTLQLPDTQARRVAAAAAGNLDVVLVAAGGP